MPCLYAIGDIHGELGVFQESLLCVDLEDQQSKLILLGDYIDRGPRGCETLYFIRDLQKSHPDQVVALMGNHEQMVLEQLFGQDCGLVSDYFQEFQNYLSDEELDAAAAKYSGEEPMHRRLYLVYREMIRRIREKHRGIWDWLKTLPYYYETDSQIFVHAGVNEEAGEYWKWGCENSDFCWKYPYTIGEFYKDIIAGHVGTSVIAGDSSYHRVYWDRQSHFYLDGTPNVSGRIPVLKYDCGSKVYSSFERVQREDGSFFWTEYCIR